MCLIFRKATLKDCDLLFEWVNDRNVRENSFNTNEIQYGDHRDWLIEKLVSEKSIIFIVHKGKIPIGQVRIDIHRKIGNIDYSISKNYRGYNYGAKMLKLLENNIENNDIKINKLIGRVKFDNLASQKVFEKLGYIKRNCNNCIEYYKEINYN